MEAYHSVQVVLSDPGTSNLYKVLVFVKLTDICVQYTKYFINDIERLTYLFKGVNEQNE